MNEVMVEHIRTTAAKNLSREELKKLLIAAGWPERQVNDYIDKTYKTVDKGSVISVHNIGKSFGEKQVLSQVDFEVKRGEIFGLIGMSGAGKTTLLNVLVGFLAPDTGDVLLALDDGTTKSVVRDPDIIKTHVGFSTQTPSFYPRLTVRENLEHFAHLYHLSEPDLARRCNALIDLVGLTDVRDVAATYLSGGMQKRLDIACAIIHDPKILILDEPTADLDPILRKQLWDLIRKINAKGTTIMLASHFLAEIELLCSRIAILQNKRIVELGTAEQLRDIYSKNYEIFVQTVSKRYDPIIAELRKKSSSKSTIEDGELVIQTPFPERVLSVIAAHVTRSDLESVHVARPTLGRVFESVVKR